MTAHSEVFSSSIHGGGAERSEAEGAPFVPSGHFPHAWGKEGLLP